MKTLRLAASLAVATLACTAGAVLAQDEGKTEAAKLTSESQAALEMLTSSVPLAAELKKTAVAILVFPSITKAGLGIGGQYGEGTLLKKGTAAAYYKNTGASFGLQAGGQKYGYAMFFTSPKAVT
jgi:lipid-binding SYLF domain-containing protein